MRDRELIIWVGLLVSLLWFSSCKLSWGNEIVTDFEDTSVPILNEELRKIDQKISVLEATPTFTPTASNALAGSVLQVLNAQTTALVRSNTAFPYDDTIPQKTEGVEVVTKAITPSSASNGLLIEIVLQGSSEASDIWGGALFQDDTADALACGYSYNATVHPTSLTITYYMAAGTTSATTFKVRAGSNSGFISINGYNAGRVGGGVCTSSITITEIKA